MIFLIAGRVGSGKHHLANLLKQNGMTESAVVDGDITDMTANLCIVTPDDIYTITEKHPDTAFKLIYLHAEDIERRFNYVKHEEKKIEAEQRFVEIDDNEDFAHSELEDKIKVIDDDDMDWIPDNLVGIYRYANDYSENDINTYANALLRDNKLHNRLVSIITYLAKKGVISFDETDKKKVVATFKDGSKTISIDYFADLLTSQEKTFSEFMKMYLSISERLNDADMVDETENA